MIERHEEQITTGTRVCSWCQRTYGVAPWLRAGLITHGICPTCYERERAADFTAALADPLPPARDDEPHNADRQEVLRRVAGGSLESHPGRAPLPLAGEPAGTLPLDSSSHATPGRGFSLDRGGSVDGTAQGKPAYEVRKQGTEPTPSPRGGAHPARSPQTRKGQSEARLASARRDPLFDDGTCSRWHDDGTPASASKLPALLAAVTVILFALGWAFVVKGCA